MQGHIIFPGRCPRLSHYDALRQTVMRLSSVPKAQNVIAQGNALGTHHTRRWMKQSAESSYCGNALLCKSSNSCIAEKVFRQQDQRVFSCSPPISAEKGHCDNCPFFCPLSLVERLTTSTRLPTGERARVRGKAETSKTSCYEPPRTCARQAPSSGLRPPSPPISGEKGQGVIGDVQSAADSQKGKSRI